jgi:hypothetical protein
VAAIDAAEAVEVVKAHNACTAHRNCRGGSGHIEDEGQKVPAWWAASAVTALEVRWVGGMKEASERIQVRCRFAAQSCLRSQREAASSSGSSGECDDIA